MVLVAYQLGLHEGRHENDRQTAGSPPPLKRRRQPPTLSSRPPHARQARMFRRWACPVAANASTPDLKRTNGFRREREPRLERMFKRAAIRARPSLLGALLQGQRWHGSIAVANCSLNRAS